MSIKEVTRQIRAGGIPVAYRQFRQKQKPPFLIYFGDGQTVFNADNTFYCAENDYQLEYYFTEKDEEKEKFIERLLLQGGFQYEKSADTFIESENLSVIYYQI